MKKSALCTTFITFFIFLSIADVQAQEPLKAKKYDNPQWKFIVLASYKPGTFTRGKEIVETYFVKSSQKAGTPVPAMRIDLISGEWSTMTVWDLKEGLEQFNWETSPDDVKWRTALNELAGGADKAKAILDEHNSYIINRCRYIGRAR
jgi:hypothetical protein